MCFSTLEPTQKLFADARRDCGVIRFGLGKTVLDRDRIGQDRLGKNALVQLTGNFLEGKTFKGKNVT